MGIVSVLHGCGSTSAYQIRQGPTGTPAAASPYGLTKNDGGQAQPCVPGTRPSLDEELWVIARTDDQRAAPAHPNDEAPRSGSMMTRVDDQPVPVPLQHTDVHASIISTIAAVDVTQRFVNPFAGKIEAVYIFPLPENAAVSEFVMSIGDRHIRGLIRDRQEAEKIYQEARSQGYVASLLTQERPNVFTQSVANIEPGKSIDVNIRYFHTLSCRDNWYEFVFPMVVGPRFNPPGFAEGIGAEPRGQAGSSGQQTSVAYLKPGERSGHDLSLTVDLNAGVGIEEIACTSHTIETERRSADRARVRISAADAVPNKDFVLRYKLAGADVKSSLIAQQTPDGGYFTLTLVPPDNLADLPRQPLELVFVLDCSGSMMGEPLTQAKAAIRAALDTMQPADTFQIVRFSDTASTLGDHPIAATNQNILQAKSYVDALTSEGGTIMIEGIRAALAFKHDPERMRFVVFLTDGYIGNESHILAEQHRLIGESRVFSFGVGSSPNRFLMDRMAKMGRGAVAYLGLRDDGAMVMRSFFAAASRPALTNIAIDWNGLNASELFPGTGVPGVDAAARLPDLFVGRPVVLSGRYNGQLPESIRIHADAGGSERTINVEVARAEGDLAAHAIEKVWARQKIGAYSDWSILPEARQLGAEIRSIALQHGLMSEFTAFLAVDSSRITEGSHGTTIAVPVPRPEGVRYETWVGGRAGER